MRSDLHKDSDFLERASIARRLQDEAASLRADSEDAKSRLRAALVRTRTYASEARKCLDEARAQLRQWAPGQTKHAGEGPDLFTPL